MPVRLRRVSAAAHSGNFPRMPQTLTIDGEHLTLESLDLIARGDARLALADAARRSMAASRARLESIMSSGRAVYGANAGFGALSDVRIPPADIEVRFLR